jgi:acylphosphatase
MPERLQVLFSGHVQGIGFRYTVKQTALGFEVTGWVKNLADGRVELLVEGEREELEAFQAAIPEAGLRRFIREIQSEWSNGTGEFRGFEIAR